MRLWRTGLGDEARVRNTRRGLGERKRAHLPADHVRQLDGPARDSTEPNEHRCAYGARRMRGGEGPKIKEASFALGAQSEPTATWRQLPPARLVRAGDQFITVYKID